MTVIAVDASYLLATDSGVWDRGMAGGCDKIFDLSLSLGTRAFAAGCGRLAAVTACIDWLAAGGSRDRWPDACKVEDWGEVILVFPDEQRVLTFCATTPSYGRLHPPLTIGEAAAAGAALHEMVHHGVDAGHALIRILSTGRFDSIRGPIRSSEEPSLPRPGAPCGLLSR